MSQNSITLDNFPNICNYLYYQQTIPSNQTSVSNFIDITNNNNLKMIQQMDQLDESNKINKLLKTLYNLKLNFVNQSILDELNNCKKIKKLISEVDKKKLLIEKVALLNKLCMSVFFSYDVCDNPNDGLPYILCINIDTLPFAKNYYFDSRYSREVNGYNDYCFNVLSYVSKNYHSIFGDLDIYRIYDSVLKFIKMIAPYILSNVKKRDVQSRINQYTLENINNYLPNIDLLHESFIQELRLINKGNTNILFPNNLSDMKTNVNFNMTNEYCKFSSDITNDYDNGDYYWALINYLFGQYDCQDNPEIQTIIDDYILWTILESKFGYISDVTRKMKFDFYSGFLLGQREEKPIKERTINSLSEQLPELIGKLFCDNYFLPSHKNQMNILVDYLLNAYRDNFMNKCKWTDKMSLVEAINKIEKLRINKKIGYPEESSYMEDYNILFQLLDYYDTSKFTLLDYSLLFCKWSVLLDIQMYYRDKKDMNKWEMSAIKTNAYYHPFRNEIVFPAGILQEPFFVYLNENEIQNGKLIGIDDKIWLDRIRIANSYPKYNSIRYITMATNFGAIGAVIGHEISHGFDDNGSKFDSNGKMKTWWTDKVKNAYQQITDKIVQQYNQYSVTVEDQTYNINGKLTLGENISDLFGLRVTIDAYKKYHQSIKQNKSLQDGLMELFVSFGTTWRYLELPKKTKNRISVDVHAPPKIRITGTLRNIREFYEVFGIEPNMEIIEIFG